MGDPSDNSDDNWRNDNNTPGIYFGMRAQSAAWTECLGLLKYVWKCFGADMSVVFVHLGDAVRSGYRTR